MSEKRCLRNRGAERPKAFWGALIGSLINAGASIYSSYKQSQLQREQIENQNRLARESFERSNAEQTAVNLNNYINAQNEADKEKEVLKYKNGGRRRLRNGVNITDGGYAIPVGNETYLLRGGLHSQVNESGKTGIGINAGGKEIEAENGEVIQKKGNDLRIYSAQPIIGGVSPAEAVLEGNNKDAVFKAQENIKKRYHLSNNNIPAKRKKALWGATFTTPDYIGLGSNVLGSILSNVYANKAYNDLIDDVDYTLPEYIDESYVAGPTKWNNSAQRAEIERARLTGRRSIARNTASSAVGLGRMQNLDTNAMYELNKLWDEKANKETEMRQANAEREQQVRARNAQNRNLWLKNVADAKNKMLDTRLGLMQNRLSSNVGMIQGIGSSVGNFLQQGIDNYQADQARRIMLAASPYGSAERASQFGVDFSVPTMRALRNEASNRMTRFADSTTESGINSYNDALDSYNYWSKILGVPLSIYSRKKLSSTKPITEVSNNDDGYEYDRRHYSR